MLKPLTTLVLMCFAGTAMADVTIIMQDASGLNGEYKSNSTVRVKNGTVVMSEGDSADGALMFKESDNSIIQIDHSSRSYMVIDQEMANKMSSAISQQMAMIQEKLKDLPAEQREMIMARMPNMPQAGGKPERTVERTGKKQTVNGISCEVVNVQVDGQPDGGACVASPKDLGINSSDFATIKSMMNAISTFAEQFGTNEMPDFDAIGGFPIKYNNANQDDDRNVSELQSVSTDELSDKYFMIPEGYTQQSFGR